jgi:ubiquinone/menaquinone biosynthesis C-methylase UbiE
MQQQDSSIPYSVDPRFLAEQVRLARQHQLITYQVMNGLFASLPSDLSHVKRGSILSFGCGSGDWPLECAAQYPHAEVLGIDSRREMLGYAVAQGEERHLENASFRFMDITAPLDFEPETFDFVAMHYLEHVLQANTIEAQIHEFFRILKPGGGFTWVEIEDGVTNSPMQLKMAELYYQAMRGMGRALTSPPAGKTLSFLLDLRATITRAGFSILGLQPYLLDYSAGQPLHRAWVENQRIGVELLAQSRLDTKHAEWDKLREFLDQLIAEQDEAGYVALALITQFYARKPS